MASWVCCNSCFLPQSADRKLAVTSCGHVICSGCYQRGYQRGQPGSCYICNAKCQLSPLSDKSSPGVKALFSNIKVVAAKHLTEISQVIKYQEKHQKRLFTHYEQRNEKLEEAVVRVKQEMQQMTKKLNEQSAYIAKLENALKLQSTKASSGHHMSHSSQTPYGHKPVLQIPYNSSVSLSRHSSATNVTENMEVDQRSLFWKPNSGSFIRASQDGWTGTMPHRSSNPNMSASHAACSATVSRFQGGPFTPDVSFGQSSGWKSPIFRPPSSSRHSMS
ncbi:probable E3 SUMO-protein ligase RNF212 isoform X1 [Haplochromis burtoni]|uniref:Ring finger protein 212 n=1 Tax=Haplochromis burtoni TaxID=8153 RepID=A0A3Q2WI06_HAPBU|nr:probable E3 SUMO-protein ligase RNF212 isoform X1 [Haplochromis burtoni]XP_042075410.1 probable E3 SUMO-protein ligase RNF212 isoform X1 [Haplochromis burtoni]